MGDEYNSPVPNHLQIGNPHTMMMACEHCKYETAVAQLLESTKLNSKEFLNDLNTEMFRLLDGRNPDDCTKCEFFNKGLRRMSRLQFAQIVQQRRKAAINQEIIGMARPPLDLDMKPVNLATPCYLDQNIFDQCRRHEAIYAKFRQKEDIDYVYSLVHVDEVLKCKDQVTKEEYFRIIESMTSDTTVYVQNHQYPIFGFAKMNPQAYIETIEHFKDLTELEEKKRLIDFADRFVFFNKFREGVDVDRMDSDELRAILQMYDFFGVTRLYQSTNHIYNDLRVAFYALFMGLDALRYRSDKETERVISGTHDWEHLLYASNAKFFVTEDKRLRKRAEVIFKFFEFPTITMSMNEFLNNQ